MKTFKTLFALILVLNITAAFAEEVASDCSQINDGTSRSSEDRPAGEKPQGDKSDVTSA